MSTVSDSILLVLMLISEGSSTRDLNTILICNESPRSPAKGKHGCRHTVLGSEAPDCEMFTHIIENAIVVCKCRHKETT